MKFERINKNQIRCTLTSEDLESRQIRISELAYGTEKAKNLFRDMMQQAQQELGFEAENIPLMIEVIPSASGSITLIITKVEDGEELENRFSKLSSLLGDHPVLSDGFQLEGADGILDIFQKFYDAKVKSIQRKKAAKAAEEKKAEQHARAVKANEHASGIASRGNISQIGLDSVSDTVPEVAPEEVPPVDLIRLYEFGLLDDIIEAAGSIAGYYNGINSLYKDLKRDYYMLVIHQSHHTPQEFNKICNILSEYASGQTYSAASEAYLQEHKDIMIAGDAIQKLAMLA